MQDLQEAIARKNVVFIVGTGMSAHITQGAATATWTGLIHSGIRRALGFGLVEDAWAERVQDLLNSGDTEMLISAASLVQKQHRRAGHVAESKWIADDIGGLQVVSDELPKALLSMPFPVLTTNYDDLMERVSGRGSAVWTDPSAIQRVLSGASDDVGHLHGLWSQTSSLVFSEADYERLAGSPTAQHLQRAVASLKSIVFVGFGSGLEDPNFGALFDWLRASYIDSTHRHFRLCRDSEVQSLEATHANDNLVPISYGADHSDLVSFLSDLGSSIEDSGALTKAGIARDVVTIARESIAEELQADAILLETAEFDVDDSLIPPILLPVPHAEYVQARRSDSSSERIERLDPAVEASERGVMVLVSDEGAGLSTALRWLVWKQAELDGSLCPLYVNFRRCRRGRSPLRVLVRQSARQLGLISGKKDELPPVALAIDDMNPFIEGVSDNAIAEIAAMPDGFIAIGCRQGEEDDLVERLAATGVVPRVRYLGRLHQSDLTRMAQLASPARYQDVATRVARVLQTEHLPSTPFTAALLISIIISTSGGAKLATASQTAVLEQYVSLLLGRGDPWEDSRLGIDQPGRELLLTHLAEHLISQGVSGLSEADTIKRISESLEVLGWLESPVTILNNFVERRVLKRVGGLVEFARASYLCLFAAKRAQTSSDFRGMLLDSPLIYESVIGPYAALARDDRALVEIMITTLDGVFLQPDKTLSPYEPLPLGEPPKISEESGFPASEAEPPDGLEDDDVIDMSDQELPMLFFEPETDRPRVVDLLRAIDLASAVLRDSDQVEDTDLKQRALVRVLGGWGELVGELSEDSTMHEFVSRLAHELRPEDASFEMPAFERELQRTIPAAFALGGLSTSLTSRKLLLALKAALADGSLRESNERLVGAAFLIITLSEHGWPDQLKDHLEGAPNLWIIRNFLGSALIGIYETIDLPADDERALEALCAEILARGSDFANDTQRKHWIGSTRQTLKNRRLKSRALMAAKQAPELEG